MFDSLRRRLENLERLCGTKPMFPTPPEIEIEFIDARNPNAEPKYPPEHDDPEGTEGTANNNCCNMEDSS